MQSLEERVKRNNLILFFGGTAIVLFYVMAVKFNVSMSRLMFGERIPEIEYAELINGPDNLKSASREGKVVFVFFWRPSVKISDDILKWAIEWDERYRKHGLVVLAITSPEKNGQAGEETIKRLVKKRGVKFEVALSLNDENRKKFKHGSFATYYITNRFGIIETIGDATDGKEETKRELLKLF